MLRAMPTWAMPPPVLSRMESSLEPRHCSETWVVTVAVNIRRDPSFQRSPIGSFDEGVPIAVQRRGYFRDLQWVQLQVPLAGYREAWVLIKNGAGTRFLRPATTEETSAQNCISEDLQGEDPAETETDPITLEQIRGESFRIPRPDGSFISYNPESLIDYLLSSNDFADPVSRIALSDSDLARLDEIAARRRLQRPSVLRAKTRPDHVRSGPCAGPRNIPCCGEIVLHLRTFHPHPSQRALRIRFAGPDQE